MDIVLKQLPYEGEKPCPKCKRLSNWRVIDDARNIRVECESCGILKAPLSKCADSIHLAY